MELRDEAKDILDDFIFGNIWNHHNRAEDTWDITFAGNEFLMRHRNTDELFNFRVTINQGRLTKEEIKELGDDQEWWDE